MASSRGYWLRNSTLFLVREEPLGDPRFKELGERLEALQERHERGMLTSVEFLKELLNLARDVVSAERAAPQWDAKSKGRLRSPSSLMRPGILTRRSSSSEW